MDPDQVTWSSYNYEATFEISWLKIDIGLSSSPMQDYMAHLTLQIHLLLLIASIA